MFTNLQIIRLLLLLIISRPCILGLNIFCKVFCNTLQPVDLQNTVYFKIWPDGYVMHCSSSPTKPRASRGNTNVSYIIFNPVRSTITTKTNVKSVSDTITVCSVSASVEKNSTRRVTFSASNTQAVSDAFLLTESSWQRFRLLFASDSLTDRDNLRCISMYRLTLLGCPFFRRSCQRHDSAS